MSNGKIGKKLSGVLLFAVVIALLPFLGKELGLGNGEGAGGIVEAIKETVENVTEKKFETPAEDSNKEITIEVRQSKYIVDGIEMALSDIEVLIAENNPNNTTFYLEDNYASTKAWDEIKTVFANHEVSVIEK